MALQTHVHIRYRTPYMPNVELPQEVEKLMRKEITDMRKNLIRKQNALDRSTKYNSDERLKNYLHELSVRDLKNSRDVWNTWNRLRNLELSNETSVTGKNEIRRKAIQSFNMSGFTSVNEINYGGLTQFLDQVNEQFQALLWDSDQLVELFLEYYENADFRNKTPTERYEYIIRTITDELNDEHRKYNTKSKYERGYQSTVNQLNRTSFAKQAFNVPNKRKRVSNSEIEDYYKNKRKKK